MPNTTCKHCRKEFAYQAVEEKPREHRILCGDSTNAGDVSKVMDGKKAALFATDPPYLVDYTGADRPNNSGKDWSDTYHEIDIKDAEEFFRSVFTCGVGASRRRGRLVLLACPQARCSDRTHLGRTRRPEPPADYLGEAGRAAWFQLLALPP